MVLPTGTVTATVRVLGADVAAAGRIIFRPEPCSVADTNADVLYVSAEVEVTLDANGSATVELAATDTPGTVPAAWRWQARFVLVGSSPPLKLEPVSFALPAGATVNLADLVQAP